MQNVSTSADISAQTPSGMGGRLAAVDRLSLNSCAWVSAFLLCAALVILSWCVNKGFDVSDEAYYAMCWRWDTEYWGLSSFHHLMRLLPQLNPNQVISYRLWQAVCMLVSATVLSCGFTTWIHSILPSSRTLTRTNMTMLSCLVSLLIFATFPQSLSYNSLTTATIFVATGLLFWSSAAEQRLAKFVTFGAGFAAGLCLFIKFTAFAPFVPLALLLSAGLQQRSRMHHCLVFLLGVGSVLAVYFCSIETPLHWFETMQRQCSYELSHKTEHSSILSTYAAAAKTIVWLFRGAYGYMIGLPFAGTLVLLVLRRVLDSRVWVPLMLSSEAALFLFFARKFAAHGWFAHDFSSPNCFYLLGLAVIAQLAAVFISNLGKLRTLAGSAVTWRCAMAICILLALPFVCAFGTGNSIVYQATISLAPLCLAVCAMSSIVGQALGSALPVALTGLFAVVLAFFQFADGSIFNPYGLWRDGLLSQDTAVNVPNLNGLLLDRPSAEFYERLYKILWDNGFRPGDPILGFFSSQAMIYAVDGKSPAAPSYSQALPEQNCLALSKVHRQSYERMFVLQSWTLDQKYTKALKDAGYDFPQDFKLLGTLICPRIPANQGDPQFLKGKVRVFAYQPQKP